MTTNNRVQLTGNLGKDPEIRQFDNGKRASFSMATKDEFTNRAGDKSTDTQWHNICAWGKVAERASDLKKGSFVSIEGRLTTRTYVDKSGQKKFFTEVVATDIVLNERAS